jgi:dihydroorotate dehydrogenase (NAD+) catalytic subunit
MFDLSVRLGSIQLKNPLLTASGTFGYGAEYQRLYSPSILGGITLKALTMNPRVGNQPNRIYETPSGMLNSIGLQNVGIESYFTEKEPFCAELAAEGVVILANLAGQTIEEFEQLVDRLEKSEPLAGYELNVSCPNVKKGGSAFGTDPSILKELVERVRMRTKRPLLVKLAPQVTSIVQMAEVSVAAGADALSLINTIPAMAIDARKRQPILATVTGGLSGPAIKPVALRMIYEVHKVMPDIPILGMGGIMTSTDVLEFLLAGASAVSLGTVNFVDPAAPQTILRELQEYLETEGIDKISELTGALKI